MIQRVFLDIDGVCNRFQWYVLRELGYFNYEDCDYPIHCGWDIVAAANYLRNTYINPTAWTKKTFWNSVTRRMWSDTPVSEEFHWLIGHSEDLVGQDEVYFLTSPTLDPECAAGKMEWIQRFAPSWMHRQFLIGSPKHCCANPTSLLIDDADKNVDAFRDAGGHAMLVPRPWNSLHGVHTLRHMADNFHFYKSQKCPDANSSNWLTPSTLPSTRLADSLSPRS